MTTPKSCAESEVAKCLPIFFPSLIHNKHTIADSKSHASNPCAESEVAKCLPIFFPSLNTMADSKSNPSNPASVAGGSFVQSRWDVDGLGEKEVKLEAPYLIVGGMEEYEEIMHHKKSDSHHTETSGLKTNNSKENASLDDIMEELEAIGYVRHHNKDFPTHDERDETIVKKFKDNQEIPGSPQEKSTEKVNVFGRATEEIDAFIHLDKSPHRHHKETHGRSDGIDENTPKDEVKGPNV